MHSLDDIVRMNNAADGRTEKYVPLCDEAYQEFLELHYTIAHDEKLSEQQKAFDMQELHAIYF